MSTLLAVLLGGCDSINIYDEAKTDGVVVDDGQCVAPNACKDPSPCYDGTSAYTLTAGYVLKKTGTWSCSPSPPVQAVLTIQLGSFTSKYVSDNGSASASLSHDIRADLDQAEDAWTNTTPPLPNIHWNTTESNTRTDSDFSMQGDGISDIMLHDGSYSVANVLGATSCYVSGDEGCCQFTECDITFYTKYYDQYGVKHDVKWSTSSIPGAGYTSLPRKIEHELGHVLGLGHQDKNLFPSSIMIGSEALTVGRTDPSADDFTAVDYIYNTM